MLTKYGLLLHRYIDTHLHIPLVLERIDAAAAAAAAKAASAKAASDVPEASSASASASPAEADAPEPMTWPRLAASLPPGYAGCTVVCCEPESFEDTIALLNLDHGLSPAPVLSVPPAAQLDEGMTFETATAVIPVTLPLPASSKGSTASSEGSEGGSLKPNMGLMRGAFGVHPHEASKWSPAVQAQFESAMSHPAVVAWGECGLDYYYDNSPREEQKVVFREQMALAVKHRKPLVVHTREAEEDTLAMMKECLPKAWTVHIHCCTSSRALVEPLLEHFPNLYVGFTGCITFPSATAIRDTLSCVPLTRLLLETDGPFMAPVPFRGSQAHPGHVPLVAATMAEVKGVTVAELLKQVRANSRAVYGF